MFEPRVFIIIVNWNGKAVTLDCLDSLSKIAYDNYTIVVVDNASTDGSVEAIGSAYPDAVLLRQDRNLRFAGGNNAGMRYALAHGAEVLCLLNNDTTVDAMFLWQLVSRLQSDIEIGLVAPKIYYYDEPKKIWFAGGRISMWSGTMKHIGLREADEGQHDVATTIDYATGCCMAIRRKAIEEVGMFDESFFMYTEDADYSMRLRGAGYSIVYEPASKVWHRLSVASGGHLSFFKMKNKFLSNLRFFFRYATLPQKLVFPWLNVVVNSWSAIRYLVTSRR